MIVSGYDIFKETDESLKMFKDKTHNLLYSDKNYSSIFQVIEESVKEHPQKIALIYQGEKYSYSTLMEKVEKLSQILWKMKVRKGQRVLLVAESNCNFCFFLLALNKIGAITLIVSSKVTADEMNRMVDNLDLSNIFLSQSQRVKYPFFKEFCFMEDVLTETVSSHSRIKKYQSVNGNSPAVQLFTSGTTSQKKLVELTQKNILHACYSYSYVNQIGPEDSTIICNPIYHVTGLIALFYTFLISGGTIYLHEKFDVERLELELIENSITYLHLSPTAYKIFLNRKKEPFFPCVRLVASGSSFLPSEIIRKLKETFNKANIVSVYGLTETSSPATILQHVEKIENYNSVGYPFPGVFLKVLDSDYKELSVKQIGRIFLKGTNVIKAYSNQMNEDYFSHGWLNTGDVGYIDDKQRLFIVDREKDMINRGGEKIFTTEIEELLYQIDGVENCVALGLADNIYGEIPVVVLTINPNSRINLERMVAFLKKRLSKFKIPQQFYLMDEIPEIESGKFDKKKILKLISEGRLTTWQVND